eukprot:TRINITY_DN1540_c0_g1_i1.p1 TRINITY_DN1540_c0_g1~~TRINITY_DN1540_c0_g1_i1.p1  ORF type:complete len:168 (+),score=17.47 TRINITY_DN1540_c0_g1_i1:716-1219(+)
MQDLLNRWYGVEDQEWSLIYRASREGWRAQDFHKHCDFQGPTLTVIKVGNYIFGAFNPQTWKSSSTYIHEPNTWLFSLSNPDNTPVKILFDPAGNPFSIYDNPNLGPTFGGGHDICIQTNANQTAQNYSNLGYSFKLPETIANRRNCFLVGQCYFTPDEIEVYLVKK